MASLDHFVNKGHKKYFIRAKTVFAKSAILFFTIRNPDFCVRDSNGASLDRFGMNIIFSLL
jgi:hypothetical protein